MNYSIHYNNTSFGDLSSNITQVEADFVISPIYELQSATITSIRSSYEVLYENNRYIFYKI